MKGISGGGVDPGEAGGVGGCFEDQRRGGWRGREDCSWDVLFGRKNNKQTNKQNLLFPKALHFRILSYHRGRS